MAKDLTHPVDETLPKMIEKHYTLAKFADLLSVSIEKARQMAKDEPGVLKLAGENAKRQVYRIPVSVAERIVRRCANPA